MALDEVIKFFGKPEGIASIVLGAGVAGFLIKKAYFDSKQHDESHLKEDKQNNKEDDKESNEYKSVNIKNALVKDTICEIKGEITEFHPIGEAYSGLIRDESGEIPFMIDPNNNNGSYDAGEDGLIPIALNDSVKTKNPITFCGNSNDTETVFNVDLIEYKSEDKSYRIGFEDS